MSAIESYFRKLNCESIIQGCTHAFPGTDFRITEILVRSVLKAGDTCKTATYITGISSREKEAVKNHLDNLQERQAAFLALQQDAAEKTAALPHIKAPVAQEYQAVQSFLKGAASLETCQHLTPFLGAITNDNESLLKVSSFAASQLEKYPDLLLNALEQFSSETGSKLCKAIVNHLLDKKVMQLLNLQLFSKELKVGLETILVEWRKEVENQFGIGSPLAESIQSLSITCLGKSFSNSKICLGELILVYPDSYSASSS